MKQEMKLIGGYRMLEKVEIMAISPKILALNDENIFSYFNYKNVNYVKSDEWLYFNNKGVNIKILKTGIAETKELFEGKNVKDRLIGLANATQDIALKLFSTEVIYDVFINQNQNINLNYWKKNTDNEIIESLLFHFQSNMSVNIKRTTTGYRIIMKGISDIKSIVTIYIAIINTNNKLLKKMGCNNIKAVISIT